MDDYDYDVVIIGAGASGLRTALELDLNSEEILILERTSQVGGRIKTFNVRGFLLDRGFQILLTAYPEVNEVLDLAELNLGSFMNGAYIKTDNQFKTLIDPLNHPISGTISLLKQVGSIKDKWKLFRLLSSLKSQTVAEIFNHDEYTSEQYLREYGFSDDFIENFFRPFFSGIFLENGLKTSSRMFEFVYKMFAEGRAALPEDGIQAVPKQMASRLPDDVFHFQTEVKGIDQQTVQLNDQENITGQFIIDATAGFDLNNSGEPKTTEWNSTNCYYFELDEPPTSKPILYINADDGLINNLCFPSLVNKNYAPEGKHLLSVSTLGSDHETVGLIKEEIQDWFDKNTDEWSLIGRYEIEQALPPFEPDQECKNSTNFKTRDGLYQIGDVTTTPSLNGALKSGRIAGEILNQKLKEV